MSNPAAKPPYRVPSMAEIAALPWNGRTVISTFSGCGGSCLGFEMDGWRVLWANEFVPAARETYRANHPGVPLDPRSVRDVVAGDILAATGLARGEADVLEGSPPCAAFSMAGRRAAKWGETTAYSDVTERVDDLFFEFTRLLEGLQPKTFVAENVPGLVRGVAKGYFRRIAGAMRDCGYRVAARLLDAQWLGVPQRRERLVFAGVRNDLDRDPAFPRPLPYRYSCRDVLPALSVPGTRADRDDRGAFGSGREITDEPAPVVLAGSIGTHWVESAAERRKFTIGELLRVCSFPDDFVLTGSYAQQWERLGRAVPPVMMAHVARAVRTGVLDPLETAPCPR